MCKVGFESHVIPITLKPFAHGGRSNTNLSLLVSIGLKVTISPLCNPMAICFPFGDQDTTVPIKTKVIDRHTG